MKLKRIIAILLALVTVFALVGCGKARRPIVKLTLSSEDAVAILAAAGITLPDVEDVTCAGTTVKYYDGWNRYQNFSEEEIVNSGYWIFTEKYGCEIEWIEYIWEERYNALATYIQSNDAPDFMHFSTDMFPNHVMKEMFVSVNDYVDYDTPLWSGVKDIADSYASLGDNYYAFVVDTTVIQPLVYNRRVMQEAGFDDPAELYYAGDWTWDVFLDMCIEFSDADQEIYGLDGWWWERALLESTGTDVVTYNTETGLFEQHIDDPRFERVSEIYMELVRNDCMYPIGVKWVTRGNGTPGVGLKDGLTLFWVVSNVDEITKPVAEMAYNYGNMEDEEVMFVPMPRDPNGDGKHYVTADITGLALISGAKNPEGVGLLAACDRFKALDPTVVTFDKRQRTTKYLWSEDMNDMLEEYNRLKDEGNVVIAYDDGVGERLAAIVNALKELGRQLKPTSWAQMKEKYGEQIKYYTNQWNEKVAEFEAGLASGN